MGVPFAAFRVGVPFASPLGYYWCRQGCNKEFTVRTGTVFERSHIPLDKCLLAMYMVVTARKGISSLQLSKELSITQRSAWFMLGRLREALGDDPGEKLKGVVEIDEAFIGGKEANKHEWKKLHAGRGTVGKEVVLGLRERGGKSVAVHVEGTSNKVIKREVERFVEPGTTIHTDEHSGYDDLPGYIRSHVKHGAGEYVGAGDIHVNSVGIHVGCAQAGHLRDVASRLDSPPSAVRQRSDVPIERGQT